MEAAARLGLAGAALGAALGSAARAQPPAAPADTAPAAAPADTAAPPAPRTAAELHARVRAARGRQDAALRSYDALSRERVTARMALLRDVPLDRTVFRQETAARVRWSAGSGVELELLGRRRYEANLPFAPRVPVTVTGDGMAPVPYYPGRDALWIGGGAFVDPGPDTSWVRNPFAPGAEQWYAYALGDTVGIRVPAAGGGASRLTLRELRVTPHRADWRLVAGSYWFDARTSQLVRAAYRPTGTLDLLKLGRRAPDPRERPPRWVSLVTSRVVGGIDAVTIEHGFYDGRVWLPRTQVADGWVDGGPTRTRIRVEQTFRYDGVNVALPPARPVDPATLALRARADSLRALDSLQALARDARLAAARTRRDSARVWDAYARWERTGWRPYRLARDSARARRCPAGDTAAMRSATVLRYGRRLPARVFVPCSEARLAASPVFDAPLLADGEGDWQHLDPAGLRDVLGSEAATAPWAPARPTVHAGWEYTRYDRVEGLSAGAAVRRDLGRGWRAEANARYGVADHAPNGELFAEQTLDRRARRAGAYRRLVQADDYGAAFGGGASVQNAVSGLDEFFYYRALGAELTGARAAAPRPLGLPLGAGRLEWRTFAEREDRAEARARFTVGSRVFGSPDARFDRNVVDTVPGRGGLVAGGSVRWRGVLAGDDASPWRLRADARAEAVTGAWSYLRPALDLTAERTLPAFVTLRASAGAGSAVGEVPPQRWWNLGGWQTVRGVLAGSLRGPAFWLARSEAEWGRFERLHPVVFVDAGWAGQRGDWGQAFRRAAGVQSAGAGLALFSGLLRVDAAHSLGSDGRWRVAGYAVARY